MTAKTAILSRFRANSSNHVGNNGRRGIKARELWEQFEGFHAHNRSRDLATSTLRIYQSVLRIFQHWFDEKHGPEADVTAASIREWMTHLFDTGLSSTTVHGYVRSLGTFLNFLVMEEVISELDNPMRRVKKPKLPFRQIEPLTSEQIGAFLETFSKRHISDFRDYLACVLILDTGLRAGEALSVKLEGIDFDNARIKVLGKGKKTRYVYMGEKMCDLLRDYLERCRPWIADGHSVLFPTISSQAKRPTMSVTQFSAMVRNHLDRAGVPRVGSSSHRLRHTFAVNFLRNGGNVFALQRLLGHSSLEMTKKYVMLSQDDVAAEHKKASPVDKMEL